MPKIDITNKTIAKARQDAKPGATRYEITDARQRGLEIRVAARGASWSYRWQSAGKSNRLDMGALDEWGIAEAREIAGEAAIAVRSGEAPDAEWMRRQRIKRGRLTESFEPVEQPVLTWDWDEAVTEYLAEVERTLKPRTLTDYTDMLATPELARFKGRAVASITLKEMSEAIADIHARGVQREAEHVASVVRPMWKKFLGRLDQQDKSGVTDRRLMEYLEAPPRSRSTERRKKAKYAPPLHEVGRMLVIARSGVFEPRIGAAMELLLFTAQRVTAVATAFSEDFTSIGDHTEGLWSMPPSHRKTAESRGDEADHIVPLPAPAWAAVQRMLDANDDGSNGQYLFRGLRPRRAGDLVTSIAPSNLQHGMMYSPGITMRPHDMRRAFTTIGADRWEWTLEQCKTILDHNEGRASDDVTVINYLWKGTHAKWGMMRQWCQLLQEAAAEALVHDDRLADLDWIKRHVVARREEHKTGKRKGVSLQKIAAD